MTLNGIMFAHALHAPRMPVNAPGDWTQSDPFGLLHSFADLGFKMVPFNAVVALKYSCQPSLVGADCGGVA